MILQIPLVSLGTHLAGGSFRETFLFDISMTLRLVLTGDEDSSENQHLKILRTELHKKHQTGLLDGYCLYLSVDFLTFLALLQSVNSYK